MQYHAKAIEELSSVSLSLNELNEENETSV